MMDWNVVISIYRGGLRYALRFLRSLGPVERSPYYNLLVMAVEDPLATLATIEARAAEGPALFDSISRVAPAMRCFAFHSAEEFERHARSAALEWLPQLAGRSFHIRFLP